MIFVYGTLLRGEPGHHLLARARFVGEAVTEPGFELVDLGPYPAMVTGGTGVVTGEVYEVDAATLAGVDEFEEHPQVYRRTRIALATGGEAEAYLIERDRVADRPRIASGDWRRREEAFGAATMPIDGVLDLHTFRPSEVADLVQDYLDECQRLGIREVRIIHGKGRGTLRRIVHAGLERRSDVAHYALAPAERGGWGATVATLRPGRGRSRR